jgi:acyl-CoA synthetase (NDP forming)/RimJ/RimL family protein N-acetyltransferase
MSTRNLDAVFAPASVAIAGATDRAGSIGAQVTRNVADSFKGRLYAINPRRPFLPGFEMHGAVANLPEAPDLAILVTPPEAVLDTAAAFAQKGARAALIITDVKRGAERASVIRRALRTLSDASGMRIVGPNALGIHSAAIRATMSSLRAPSGGIAFVGQATMAAGAVTEWASQQHLGFSGIAASGDMIDVDFADSIDWFAADPRTRLIVVFLERLSETRRFLSAVRQAARVKPVVVLRADAEALPRERDAVFAAALRRAGALRARTLEDLFAAMEAVAVRLPSDTPPTLGRRLGVISNGESLGALARIAIEDGAGELAVLDPATIERLALLMPPGRARTNPVDILPDASPERFANALKALFEDKGVDAVLTVFGPSGVSGADAVAEAIAAVVEDARLKPGRRRPFVMTAFSGGAAEAAARDAMGRLHIPSFETPSGAVRAFNALVALRNAAERITATPEFVAGLEAPLLAEVEERAKAALARGVSTIDGPVAAAIRKALWLGRAEAPPALPWRIAVGADPDFGPAIFFGPGGAFGRIAGDATAALPPLNAATAQELIAASRHARAAIAAGLIDDGATYALAALLVRVSDLVAGAPSLATLVIDGLAAEDGRPIAPVEAISGTLSAASGDPHARFAIRPYPVHLACTVTARDGTAYRLRPMRAEDEPGLAQLGTRMTADDLRLRFFQPMRALSHDLAARLTQIDYDREMAFALLPLEGEGLLAVVRMHRETRGDSAEFAITVRSDLKGRGIGRLMMERIIAYAASQGLKTLFGLVLAENKGMLHLARAVGFTARTEPGDATIVRVERDLQTTSTGEHLNGATA